MAETQVEKIKRSVGTHSGAFHADEVTACALLVLFDLIDPDKILRTRDPKKLALREYVCDVGGVYDPKRKLFDHHQSEYKGGLSSAGMVLQYLKDEGILSIEEFDFFNNSLVAGVDAHDNGRSKQELGTSTFSHVISNFAPISYESSESEQDKAFFEAFHFTLDHLRRLWLRYQYNVQCRKTVFEEMKKGRKYLYFDKAIPWFESFFALGGKDHPALFILMPAGEHWKVRAIPPDYMRRMEVRLPLPAEWAGLLEDELKKVSGLHGAIFCHKGRFTSVWETRHDAKIALKKVFEKNGIEEQIDF